MTTRKRHGVLVSVGVTCDMGSTGLGGSDLHPALYVGFGDFARKFPPTPTAYGVEIRNGRLGWRERVCLMVPSFLFFSNPFLQLAFDFTCRRAAALRAWLLPFSALFAEWT